ncbi:MULTISPECIES: type II toxin-antitoxin system VapC family toxin [Rhizobium]|uniref:Ribonuclease VapC n=1 Tax=Rhizobium paranaense TaxID=1650438 RepID=A0A7W8XPL8_9HYPH|nr:MULTISPECIES: type II toxin-antitoxin system VapC family toxin [Rhizobium]MBB5573268.1 ribonuclease VapC [Rhizobium paranaense]PST62373.1 VapC toxin family PIN domain ribonuclease [Rhizobium sp. SEMIA4064]
MFIDASAIVAILGEEPGYEEIEKSLAKVNSDFYVSPLVKFEATLALARRKTPVPGQKPSPSLLRRAGQAIDTFIEDIGAQEIEISSDIGKAALEASARYGKAVGHKADLNFGDCFAYACAKALNVGLLYKGNDLAFTDIG